MVTPTAVHLESTVCQQFRQQLFTEAEMAGRRGNNEGSVYQRSQDGRWLGVATIGYDANGKPIRKSVSGTSRQAVVQKLKKLQRQVDEGLPAPDTAITVEQLLIRWYEDVLRHQVSITASDNYRSVAKNHIVPTLGRRKLAELTPAEVDRLLSKKLDSGLSTSSVRRIRSVLAQAIDQGVRWGMVNRNVATLARAPRMVRQEGRTLTPEQARSFLAVLDGHRHQALYALMLSTGLRRGEVLGLMWKDFDPKSGVMKVRRQLKREGGALIAADTKTKSSRRSVNIPEQMTPLIMEQKKFQEADRRYLGAAWVNSGFIFTTKLGTPIEPRNLLREFKGLCHEAGLGDWHLHELRHSAASLMLANGVKLQVVSEVLGHSSIRMTADVYGHIMDPDREAAAAVMDSVLWGEE